MTRSSLKKENEDVVQFALENKPPKTSFELSPVPLKLPVAIAKSFENHQKTELVSEEKVDSNSDLIIRPPFQTLCNPPFQKFYFYSSNKYLHIKFTPISHKSNLLNLRHPSRVCVKTCLIMQVYYFIRGNVGSQLKMKKCSNEINYNCTW